MVNVEKHLGLVHHLAKKFYRTHEELCEYDDLISAGYLALCKASIKFDETLGFQFSTFAGRVIVCEMKKLVLSDKRNYKRTAAGYERVYVHSLNEKVGDTEESKEKLELIVDCSDSYLSVDMQVTFEKFDDKEREILDLYFNKNLTQVEIAEIFNLSQVHVSRKIKKCLNILKEAM